MRWSNLLFGYKKINGEKTFIEKIGKEIILLVEQCVICNRKKSMIVSDNTIQAEGLGSFFKNLGKISVNLVKNQQPMHSKIEVDFLKSVVKLLRQPQVEILKQLYQHYLKLLSFTTKEKGFTLVNLYKLCYISGQKCDRLYASAPLENKDLEPRLEKK